MPPSRYACPDTYTQKGHIIKLLVLCVCLSAIGMHDCFNHCYYYYYHYHDCKTYDYNYEYKEADKIYGR